MQERRLCQTFGGSDKTGASARDPERRSLEAMDSNRETQRQQCLEAGSDGQDSMQRRQEEIASLQDALKAHRFRAVIDL